METKVNLLLNSLVITNKNHGPKGSEALLVYSVQFNKLVRYIFNEIEPEAGTVKGHDKDIKEFRIKKSKYDSYETTINNISQNQITPEEKQHITENLLSQQDRDKINESANDIALIKQKKPQYDAYDEQIKAVDEQIKAVDEQIKAVKAKSDKQKQGIEVVNVTSGELAGNSTTGFVSAVSASFLADETADYWFSIYLEVDSDKEGNVIDFQVKNGDTVLSETYTKIDVANSKKVINIETAKINVEKEFPYGADVLFKLHTISIGGTSKITNSRITTYRQQSTASEAPPTSDK